MLQTLLFTMQAIKSFISNKKVTVQFDGSKNSCKQRNGRVTLKFIEPVIARRTLRVVKLPQFKLVFICCFDIK